MKGQGGDHITSSGIFEVSGSVGIGTSTPSASLHIATPGPALTDIAFKIRNSGNTIDFLTVDGAGRVVQNTPYVAGGTTLLYTSDTATNDVGPILTFAGNYSGTTSVPFGMIRGAKSSVGGQRGYMSFHTGPSGASISTESMRIDWNNNVGIGHTVPSARLHVSGASASTLFQIDSPASSSILFVSGSGNVGIGTSTPRNTLEVLGSIRATTVQTTELISSQPTEQIVIKNSSGTVSARIFSDSSTYRISSAGSQSTINVFSNGNLGIWQTTDAGYRLHVTSSGVSGSLNVNGTLYVSGSRVGINTSTPANTIDINGTARVSGLLTLSSGSYTTASIGWGSQIGYYYDPTHGILTNINGVIASSITGTRINFDKPVGIGTYNMTPSAKLHVVGTGATSTTTSLLVQNSTPSTLFSILDNGNVGIGTATPSASLDVSGSARFSSASFAIGTSFPYAATYGAGNDGIIQVKDGGNDATGNYKTQMWFRPTGNVGGLGANYWGRIEQDSTGFKILPGNYQDVYVKNLATSGTTYLGGSIAFSTIGIAIPATTANVLINTATDSGHKLLVSGSGTSGSLNVNGTLYVSGSRVGIGTSTPTTRLDVSGSVRVNGVSQFVSPLGSTLGSNLTTSAAGLFYQTGLSGVLAIGGYSNAGGEIQSGQNGGISVAGSLILQRQGGNVAIGTATDTGRLTVRGTGTTNATTTFLLQNATPTNILTVLDNGTVGIGRTPTQTLDIAGTTRMSGSFNTAVSGSILTVQGSGSAQPIFTVLGSQGELFSIIDSLSGSLFSVNDISGLPIMEVFSDNTTLIGNYQAPALITTAKNTLTNSGSFTVYSIPTSSYDGAFYEYTVRSGSNARAGQIMAIWSGSSVNYTETTSSAFGTTTDLALGVFISGSNMVLTGSAATTAWTVKTIIRSI
jgi:cytoskeletal protein CcmA (bactofilin family)